MQTGHAGFGGGRNVRRAWHALRRADRDRPQLSGLDLRQQDRQVEEHHLHLLAEQIVHRRRRAAIGHVGDVDLGGELEQFARQMRQAARTGRGEIELAGLRFGQRHQLFHVVGGDAGRHHQHFRNLGDQRDGLQVL